MPYSKLLNVLIAVVAPNPPIARVPASAMDITFFDPAFNHEVSLLFAFSITLLAWSSAFTLTFASLLFNFSVALFTLSNPEVALSLSFAVGLMVLSDKLLVLDSNFSNGDDILSFNFAVGLAVWFPKSLSFFFAFSAVSSTFLTLLDDSLSPLTLIFISNL